MGARRIRKLVVAVLVTLFVPGAIGGAASATAATPYKIALYTTTGSAHPGLVGHVFVQLRHGTTNLIFGKYPGGNWIFDTDGKIKDDGDRTWGFRITYVVNSDRWGLARTYLMHQQARPDNYRLLSDNCVQFAVNVGERAHLKIPAYKNFVGVPQPSSFYSSLEEIGSGHTFHGGLVYKNPHPADTASGAPDPPSSTPPCCDVDGILGLAASSPLRLARDLHLSYRVYHLNQASLDSSGDFRVTITHTNPDDNLYAIRWGDSSHTFGVRPRTSGPGQVTFRHHYAHAPGQPLKVMIVENGQVLDYNDRLTPLGSGTHAAVVNEPPPPPQRPFP